MPACNVCGSTRLSRYTSSSLADLVRSLRGVHRYKCRDCDSRMSVMARGEVGAKVGVLAVAALVAIGSLYAIKARTASAMAQGHTQAQVRKPDSGRWMVVETGTILTNRDIVNLSRSGLSSATIIKLIERSRCTYDVSSAMMVQMKKDGVADDVMYAMIDVLDQCSAAPVKGGNY